MRFGPLDRALPGMVLVVLLGSCPDAAVGRTWYVSPSGKDGNPGTQARPWANPGYASRQLKPGDTLVIVPGRYVLARHDEDVLRPPSGKAGAWVTIRGDRRNRPVLAGRNNLPAVIDLAGASYVRIEDLEITHDDRAVGNQRYCRDGIQLVEKPGRHIVLDGLSIHHLDEFGVNIQDCEHLDLRHCRISYCGFGAVGGPAGQRGGWRQARIWGCILSYSGHYYRGGNGSGRPYDRPDGLGLEAARGPVEVANTLAEHNRGDGLDSKAEQTSIHHCIVANNSCDGIKLWGTGSKVENCLVYGTGDGQGGQSAWAGIVLQTTRPDGASFELINVTVHDNPTRLAYPLYVQYGRKEPVRVLLRNCIVAGGHGLVYFGPAVKLTAEHNLFHRPAGGAVVEAYNKEYSVANIHRGLLGPGNRCGDPKFVRPAWGRRGDYHLQAGSPAIDAGTSRGAPATDLDYRKRPQGRAVDIGCYER